MITEYTYNDVRVAVLAYADAEEILADDTFLSEYSNPARRREKALTAYLFRKCLNISDINKLKHTPDGAPFIEGSPLRISISHSHHEVALAWSQAAHPGIDIESERPGLLRVASRFLTPDEQQFYTTLPLLQRAWTIKEAVYKALLIKNLSSQEIHLSCTTPHNDTDHVTVNETHIEVHLQTLPSGSILAITEAK